MNYATIRSYDIANGEGVRVSLFVSGCKFHCHNCFNEEQQSFEYGTLYTQETENEIVELVRQPMISGLSILGGDPMWQNAHGISELCSLCDRIHSIGKTVWLWTGFTYEDLMCHPMNQNIIPLMRRLDVMVDGLFRQELASPRLVWRGSSNQRVIDMNETRRVSKLEASNQICLLPISH